MSKPIWNADAKEVAALVSLARSQGGAEGKGSQALPNIALAFAASAAAGKVKDVKADAEKIYVAYGNARNASGAGKTIKTEGKAIDPPVSKLGTFAKLAMNPKVLPGSNQSVAEAFFDAYAFDLDLYRGSHYENLYKAVAYQNKVLENEARLVDREELVSLLVIRDMVVHTEVTSLEEILKALDVHIYGKRNKKGALIDPSRPALGSMNGELSAIVKKLEGLKNAAKTRLGKDWSAVNKDASAFADDEEETAEDNSEATEKKAGGQSFMSAH